MEAAKGMRGLDWPCFITSLSFICIIANLKQNYGTTCINSSFACPNCCILPNCSFRNKVEFYMIMEQRTGWPTWDFSKDKERMNIEDDRLSNLPDDLIHKILSFNGLKNAIRTSVLSSRWRYIWTSMPYLDFSTEEFLTSSKFSNYVSNVMSSRNNQLKVFSLKLCCSGDISQKFVKKNMKYASSHNIQHLNVVCSLERDIEFPISLFSSSLKHLTLTSYFTISGGEFSSDLRASSNLELPALTTLHLFGVTLCCDETTNKSVDLFPKCPNLKNLTLKCCSLMGLLDVLSICHPLLSDLTLDEVSGRVNSINVVTPQLKTLTIRKRFWDYSPYVISAPDLASLEKVDLRDFDRDFEDAPRMFHLLQQLHNVKFLTLNLEIVELLSSAVGLISNQPSPFTSLRSLKIYPCLAFESELSKEKLNITEVKSYLLDSSPNATFTMVTREEIIAKGNTELAHMRMKKLRNQLKWGLIELWRKTNMAQIDRGKTMMESDKENILEPHIAKLEHLTQLEKTMSHTNTCCKDLNSQIKRGKTTISNIISGLHDIIKILAKLPTSNRAELQPCFSSLCSEADIVVNKRMDHVKNLCDNEGRLF